MAVIDVRGAIDMHCHSGPAVFQRIGDARDISWRAKQAGMRGVLFKSHHTSTFDRAYFVNKEFARIAEETGEAFDYEAFGSIALNHYVGGVNPVAVGDALEQGCKEVFMPVMHSAYHAKVFGGTGTYGIASMTTSDSGSSTGLTILDQEEQLTPEAKEIVDLVIRHNALLGTAHLSPEEQLILADYAIPRGATVVVTHVYFLPTAGLSFYETMAEKGAVIELCAVMAFPMALHQAEGFTLEQAVELVEAVGADQCIMGSDAGQPFNPWPDEALRIFAQLLYEVGVSEEDLHKMMVANPRKLLRITD